METKEVDVATMDLTSAGFAPADVSPLFQRMAQRVKEMPGIADVAIGGALPFNSSYATRFRVPGIDSLPRVPDGGPYVNAVTPEFFKALGVHILRGRAFTSADVAAHAPVMVIGEAMARLIWRGRDPIGQCVRYDNDTLPCMTIVGISENAHRNGIVERSEVLQYYVPLAYAPAFMTDRILFIRPADGAPDRWVDQLRRTLQTSAPRLPYADVRPMHTLLDGEMRPWRLGATMFAVFGALALVLTALGLYSVVAYGVAERTHEFGVRIALGADAGHVMGIVVRHGLGIAIAGAVLGTAIAITGGRFIEPLLFQVSPRDPLTFVLVAAVLVIVAVVASALPAWRAAKVPPVIALKTD
jgi:predicted permease